MFFPFHTQHSNSLNFNPRSQTRNHAAQYGNGHSLSFLKPQSDGAKSLPLKDCNGHSLPPVAWRRLAAWEVQSTLEATRSPPPERTWIMPSITSHPGSPGTQGMTYSNLPAYLLGYVLVWVLNFPIPTVKFHMEQRPRSILSSS